MIRAYFQNRNSKTPGSSPRDRAPLAYVMLLFGMVLTATMAFVVQRSLNVAETLRFRLVSDEIRQTLDHRLAEYSGALQHSRALFQLAPNMTPEMFQGFVQEMSDSKRLPGLLGVGVVAAAKSGFNVQRFEPASRLGSAGAAVIEVEFDRDFNDEPDTLAALELARDAGLPSLSSSKRIQLGIQSTEGHLLFVPIFKNGKPKTDWTSWNENRLNLTGYLFAVIDTKELFSSTLRYDLEVGGLSKRAVEIEIYEGEIDPSSRPLETSALYVHSYPDRRVKTPKNSPAHEAKLKTLNTLQFGSRSFVLSVSSRPEFENPIFRWITGCILLLGTLISLVTFRLLRNQALHSEKLALSEKQTRLVTDALPALVYYIDLECKVRFANLAFENWLGVIPQAAIGTHFREVWGPENFSQAATEIQRTLQGERVRFELKLHTRQGVIPAHSEFVPDFGAQGEIKGFFGLTRDITERKSRETRNLLRAEISAALVSSLEIEKAISAAAKTLCPAIADWCTIDLLPEHAKVDAKHEQGPCLTIASICSDLDKKKIFEEIIKRRGNTHTRLAWRVIREERPLLVNSPSPMELLPTTTDYRELNLTKDLETQSVVCLPLCVRNEILGTMTIGLTRRNQHFDTIDMEFAADLAKRIAVSIENARLYRETERASRAKDEFLANLSHELRTPMNVIMGWLELLSTDDLDGSSRDLAMTTLHRNAKAQLQLINDLLDVSRIISGKFILKLQRSDLVPLVQTCVDGFVPAFKAKGVDLKFEPQMAMAFVEADAGRLYQVVWNLLSNALKFTSEGGRVSVFIKETESGPRVEVVDSGSGIASEFLPFIFERFRQEDGSFSRSQGGLGLGLSIVRYLVELHGGTVEAHSPGRDQGSSFALQFPRLIEEATSLTPFPDNEARVETHERRGLETTVVPHGRLHGVRILLVDDSPDIRVLITRILAKAGALVTTAESTVEADRALAEGSFHMLISDIGMPGEDGLSFIKRWRATEEKSGRSRLLSAALTAFAQESDARAAIAAGFDLHIAKPVTSRNLTDTVSLLLEEHGWIEGVDRGGSIAAEEVRHPRRSDFVFADARD